MTIPKVEEIECKSVLNRVAGMGFKWSANPYRGCAHGCHYCFARRYHGFLDLNPSEDFSGLVFAKINAGQVIRQELRQPGWKRELVVVGTATDPYQPIEGKYRITRAILRALVDYHTPFVIITKGPMIVRDIDILSEAAQNEGCRVCFSIVTLSREVARDLEPGTAPPMQRMKALERLRQAGVTAGVLMMPIVPALTSDLNNLESVIQAAADHGASFIGTGLLRLEPGTRDHFMRYLETAHPELLPKYKALYPGPYAPAFLSEQIGRLVTVIRQRTTIPERLPEQMGPRPLQPAFEFAKQ